MTRYRVPVADPLLAERDYWLAVEGFRLVSVDGPWLAHPDVTICTFEDDNAPGILEDLLIVPVISLNTETGAGQVTDRQVVRSP